MLCKEFVSFFRDLCLFCCEFLSIFVVFFLFGSELTMFCLDLSLSFAVSFLCRVCLLWYKFADFFSRVLAARRVCFVISFVFILL